MTFFSAGFKNSSLLICSMFLLGACGRISVSSLDKNTLDPLYSMDGREHQVKFHALYRSTKSRIEDIFPQYLKGEIDESTHFLFGPLTRRDIGGIQKGQTIELQMQEAYLENGRVMVPYSYTGTWLIHDEALKSSRLHLPLPYSIQDLKTEKWKNCTDSSDPEHSTWGFFWYFWDPERPGCDHQLGRHYQEVQLEIGQETIPTQLSFPEYKNLIRHENGRSTLSMTFAFGYVDDVNAGSPFTDSDSGMREFREFYSFVKKQLGPLNFHEDSIRQSEMGTGSRVIGSRFSGLQNNIQIEVSIVAASGVDQMDIFADSYAKKHEGFFGWFGHSRVGGGFDADQFQRNLQRHPDVFSLSPNYQLIYWAGCNSYSYYTLPFFKLKSAMNPALDPNGTKNLDIISNALPSLFSFNAFNAKVLFNALMNWERPTSYQTIVNRLETNAVNYGYPAMVNVLGDEDNTKE